MKGKKNKRKQISLSLAPFWRRLRRLGGCNFLLAIYTKEQQQKNLDRCDAVEIDFMRKVM